MRKGDVGIHQFVIIVISVVIVATLIAVISTGISDIILNIVEGALNR